MNDLPPPELELSDMVIASLIAIALTIWFGFWLWNSHFFKDNDDEK